MTGTVQIRPTSGTGFSVFWKFAIVMIVAAGLSTSFGIRQAEAKHQLGAFVAGAIVGGIIAHHVVRHHHKKRYRVIRVKPRYHYHHVRPIIGIKVYKHHHHRHHHKRYRIGY
ncbi:MAG: hypothetical protein KDJ67_16005 [Nitratireductor sp.]|nr:hypothetical protein [Nitratireductor sp.]